MSQCLPFLYTSRTQVIQLRNQKQGSHIVQRIYMLFSVLSYQNDWTEDYSEKYADDSEFQDYSRLVEKEGLI